MPRATPPELMFQIMIPDRDACPVLKQNKERSGEARVLLGGALDKMEGLIDILAG